MRMKLTCNDIVGDADFASIEQADWIAEPFGLILIALLFLVLIAVSLAIAITRRTKRLVSATTPASGEAES